MAPSTSRPKPRGSALAAVRGSAVYLDPCDSLRSHARFPLTKIPQSLRDSSLYKGAVVFECQCVESFLPRDDVELLILRCTFCRCVSFMEADDQWSPLRRTNGSNHAEHVYHQPRGCISSMRTHCISSRVACIAKVVEDVFYGSSRTSTPTSKRQYARHPERKSRDLYLSRDVEDVDPYE